VDIRLESEHKGPSSGLYIQIHPFELVVIQKSCGCLSIFIFSFILLTSGMAFIGMGLVANSSMTTTQHTSYLPSQENQTVFANYSYDSGDTTSSNPSISVRIDVVDQDGVEMVWFLYRRTNESQWSNNKSMVISPAFGENTFSGSFRVTLAPYTTEFDIQFFANDSLGHVAESVVYQLMAHYNPGDPPRISLHYH